VGQTIMPARVDDDRRTQLESVFHTSRSMVQPHRVAPTAVPQPRISGGMIHDNGGTGNTQPGSFVTLTAANRAWSGVAGSLRPVPRGSRGTVNGVAAPRLRPSGIGIQGQIPHDVVPGMFGAAVRPPATAQDRDPVVAEVVRRGLKWFGRKFLLSILILRGRVRVI
jgi:hypothetical protein